MTETVKTLVSIQLDHPLTPDALAMLLDCDPNTGQLKWKPRAKSEFLTWSEDTLATWNKKYAGRAALNFKNKSGHLSGRILGRNYYAHRVIWAICYMAWPKKHIDHINGDPADNRLQNLRDVSVSTNAKNRAVSSNNTSGVMGVTFRQRGQAWCAAIKVDGKDKHLGSFRTKEEAIAARKAAETSFGFHENHNRLAPMSKERE